jgi:CRISPR system Cascade subunit CasE
VRYFSRIRLDKSHSRAREALLEGGQEDAYADHRWLWRFFPAEPGAPRGFLFRRIEPHAARGGPILYTISSRQPEPAHPAWQVDSRPYDPQVPTGARLSFELRINPVQARARDGGRKRDDVVMHAKRRILTERGAKAWRELDAATRPPLYELAHRTVVTWFTGEEEQGVAARHGFRVADGTMRVDAYRQHRFSRKGSQPIRISTVDLSGVLEVTDTARARTALLNGIGHAKAFGCGLLLVRRLG